MTRKALDKTQKRKVDQVERITDMRFKKNPY
jgi:hypothetical protein